MLFKSHGFWRKHTKKINMATIKKILISIIKKFPKFEWRIHYRNILNLLRSELQQRPGDVHFKVLEVGALEGLSTILFAKELKRAGKGNVTTIDLWEDQPGQHYNFKKVEEEFKKNIEESGSAKIVTAIKGNSNLILPTLTKDYDFIFIDGGHEYSQVKKDIQNCIPLLKDGGVLCGDDLELRVGEIDIEFMKKNRENNNTVIDPKTGAAYHAGVTAAVDEIFGLVPQDRGHWAVRKVKDSFVPLKLISKFT